MSERHPARRMWQLLEPIHDVTYFSPEPREHLKGIGLRRFWMGYFASRSAPMGAVSAGVVDATFYNFSPEWVRDAIPAAWEVATPAAVVAARAAGAAVALRRLVPDIDATAPKIVPLLNSAVRSANCQGRALAAGNQGLPLPDDPVAALWQCATTLREHRGDGHVASLVARRIDGLEAHLLHIGAGAVAGEVVRAARGWSDGEWDAATQRLVDRGLLHADGSLTAAGEEIVEDLERSTDDAAVQPYTDGLTDAGLSLLPSLLRPLTAAIVAADEIPPTSPIGLDTTALDS